MKRSKIIMSIAAVSMVVAVTIGGTLAYFTDNGQLSNTFAMGKVNIELTEPLFGEATDNTYKVGDVQPGQVITKDPTVTVDADSLEAYIRVKIEISGLDKIELGDQSVDYTQSLEDTFLVGNKSMEEYGWYYSNGYYYYKESVAPGDSVKVFDTFHIPEKWGNEFAGIVFGINVTAEAVQASNFTPAKDSNGNITGWYYSDGTEIQPQAYVTN